MSRFALAIPFALAFALAAATTVHADSRQLSYHRLTGQTEGYTIDIKASVPTQGDQEANIAVSEKAISSEGDGFHAQATVDTTGAGAGHAQGTYRISSVGDLSELAATGKDDNITTSLKNLALLYVPLSDQAVDVGASWGGQRVLYAPDTGSGFTMPPLTLLVACKLAGYEDHGGKTLARIDVTAMQAPNQENQADLSGSYYLDPDAGRVVQASISGTLHVKVSFMTVDVPIQVTIGAAK